MAKGAGETETKGRSVPWFAAFVDGASSAGIDAHALILSTLGTLALHLRARVIRSSAAMESSPSALRAEY
jgi:hypothetical protein